MIVDGMTGDARQRRSRLEESSELGVSSRNGRNTECRAESLPQDRFILPRGLAAFKRFTQTLGGPPG